MPDGKTYQEDFSSREEAHKACPIGCGVVEGSSAALWAESAQFEHASIGSFAKFSLHLLAVRAPPELLYACHDAARDELKHAELCFGLASRYARRPLGPGPLPLPVHVLGATDLASVLRAAIEEGCVGETLASLEAAEE